MKLKPTTVRAGVVLALGLLIVGFTVWKTYPRTSKRALPTAQTKYMHCAEPECMAESRYDLEGFDKPCPLCGSDKGMIPTDVSLKDMAAKSKYGRLVSFVLPELVVLLTALWFVLRPRESSAENYRYMRCPNCAQKLRYREAQIGSLGACSRCKRAFRFPEGTTQEKDLDGGVAAEEYSEVEED